ncbi:MAG: hypothetical protein GY850_31805 [bacterium]|nr:hypothetical protein [bacterium]
MKKRFIICIAVLLLLSLLIWFNKGGNPEPIPSAKITAPLLIGSPAVAKPVTPNNRPHPYMAPGGISTIHAGGDNSDVHLTSGPLARNPKVISRQGTKFPGGMHSSFIFTRDELMIVFSGSFGGFKLLLLDPETLEMLASLKLPGRPSTLAAIVTADMDKIMADTSGGAYFYLDHEDYVVLADSRQVVQRIGHRKTDKSKWEFYIAESWDLSEYIPQDCLSPFNWFPDGECDPITTVTPDYNGLIWWVTRLGRIGTLNTKDGSVKMIHLPGEEIQNSFSVTQDGVYIVSDHKMYCLEAAKDGTPEILWKEVYDRGTVRKPGLINQGAGATPTLIADDYVAITDNADGRVNLVVYRRAVDLKGKERLACKVPLFKEGASAAESSIITWGRSMIILNTFGYLNVFQQKDWDMIPGGMVRIDIKEDEQGCQCETIWTSQERAPSILPKLSAGNGLVYYYNYEPQENGKNAYYLMALDAQTGETVFKILTGGGSRYDGNWGTLSIGPNGTAYVSTVKGMVAVRDRI